MLYICGKKYSIMKTSIKKRITFRFDSDLLDALRLAAKHEHQSLNNFVETQLMQFMYTELNEETRTAKNLHLKNPNK